jgi:hypothetical protein
MEDKDKYLFKTFELLQKKDSMESKLYRIKLARESDYPASKIEKLNKRQQKCEKIMEINDPEPEEDLRHYIKLSHSANEKIPWMIEDLEMRTTEKYGREIYTTRDLRAGEIICIEDTKLNLLDFDGFYKCCNNCTKTSMMNLIPCLKTGELK